MRSPRRRVLPRRRVRDQQAGVLDRDDDAQRVGLRGYAIGELASFDSITRLPAGPAGSPLGDALDAVAVAAQRRLGYGPDMTWALAGRFGLCQFLQPARAG